MSITSPSDPDVTFERILGGRLFVCADSCILIYDWGFSSFIPLVTPAIPATPPAAACPGFNDALMAITLPDSNCKQIPFGDFNTITF